MYPTAVGYNGLLGSCLRSTFMIEVVQCETWQRRTRAHKTTRLPASRLS